MAKFLNNIDLVGNEIQNVVLQPLGAVPSSNVKVGRKFFDTTEGREKIYDGSVWKLVAYLSDLEALNSENATILEEIEAVRASVEALNNALNEDDTENIINTWEEIQSLVSAFQEGTDLSSILAEINSTVQTHDNTLGALEERTSELETTTSSLATTVANLSKSDVGLGNVDNLAAKDYLTSFTIDSEGDLSITIGGITRAIQHERLQEALGIPSGVARKYTGVIAPVDGQTDYDVTHSLNTAFFVASVQDAISGEIVLVDIKYKTNNAITISFAEPPQKSYKIMVIG